MSKRLRPADLIRLLAESGFEFVLIGGVAAIAYGAGQPTKDLDVSAPFTADNLKRLLTAMLGHHPRFALTVDKRPVTQTADELASFSNLYLDTDLGRIDILKAVDAIGPYEEVRRRAQTVELFGQAVRIIALDDLIASKAHLGRDKDKLVELELRAIRDKLRSR